MSQQRVHIAKAAPQAYEAMGKLEAAIQEFAQSAGLDKGFLYLLKLRASQMNSCAFCARMHTREALACGESTDRIAVVAAWRDSGYFTPEERAALALIEAVTDIGINHQRDDVYTDAAEVLSPEQIAAVQWIGVGINSWNRIAVVSQFPVDP